MTPLARSLAVNGTLLVLALGSLALVLVTERAPTTAEVESRRQHLFERFEEDLVDGLELKHDGALTIVRGDTEARFLITAPVEAVAEEATVDQLLREARFATWLRRLPEEDVDAERMGLDPAVASVTFSVAGERLELAVGGDASSPPGARYVRVRDGRGEHVYVVSSSTAESLTPQLADFRIQRLLPVPESELSAMEFSSPRGHVRLERQGRWRLVGAHGAVRLDPSAMARLFLQFARTEARDFVDLERAREAQSKDEDTVTVKLFGSKPEQTSELALGGKCPFDAGLTVAWRKAPEPIAACIQSDLETAFLDHPELLLDRKLFALRLDEVEEVRLESGAARLEFARKGEGYVMRAPKTGDVDKRAGDARLLGLLEARGNLLPKGDATFEPIARASIVRSGVRESERRTEVVELGSLGQHPFVARRADDGALIEVDEVTRASFGVDALMLRSPLLFEVEADDIREVEVHWVEGRDAPRVQRVRQPQRGIFELEAPEGYEVDSGLALDLVDALHHLEVSEWVSETLEPRFGLDKPTLTCRVRLEGRDEPRVLELGASASGGVYGTLDRDGVFVLPRSVRELLTTWVVDRSPFMLETDRLESVELSAEDRRLELTRVGMSFVQTNSGPAVSPTRIVDLLDALSLLRTEALVTPSDPRPEHGTQKPRLRVVAKLRGESGQQGEVRRFTIGNADTLLDAAIFYAWPDGAHAVYALPRESVRRILNLW